MKRVISILALAGSLAFSSAQAQDSMLWKTVGDWDISIDTTIGNGCYAVATWNGGTTLRIGRHPENRNFYFLVGNEKWASLRDGVEYDVEIRFGSRSPWEVSARGLQFNPGEVVYLHAQSKKMEFIREFQRALKMRISYDGSEIDTLKLTGSRKAWDAVEACQREVNARGISGLNDPFSGSTSSTGTGRKSVDPFAN